MAGEKSGIAVGVNRGHIVTKPKVNRRKLKPSYTHGRLNRRVKLVRDVIRETVGFTPLEKKMTEAFKSGDVAKEKRAMRLCRKRIGSYKRSLVKRREIEAIVQAQRQKK